MSDFSAAKFATGVYYQPPTEQQTSPQAGNPDLVSSRAYHFAWGWEQDFRRGSSEGFQLTSGPFLKYFRDLVVPSNRFVTRNGQNAPEGFSNRARGKAYGWEALLKWDSHPWKGSLSYTLSRSTREEDGQPDYISAYDQTHNLNLIESVDLPRNWRIAGRFRYVTGNPITPVTGSVFDADNDAYIPIRGSFYSQRVAPFYQLDLRADKKWIFNRWILSFYVDIQNATNRKNVESVNYSYDYSTRQDVNSLPILPSVGLKGEF
jgi:hypothetical protein